jgi:hypothetical protein
MSTRPKQKADKRALWFNLQALMKEKWGGPNMRRLAHEAGIGEMTAYRLRDEDETSVGLEIIEAAGRVFRRLPYQLLDPRPGATALSAPALEIAKMFDRLDADRQQSAFALIVQILEFGNVGAAQATPTDGPSPAQYPAQRTPPAPGPASHAPTPARETSRAGQKPGRSR